MTDPKDPSRPLSEDIRVHPRVPVALAVDFSCLGRLQSTFSTNLSHGGLFLRTSEPLPVGTVLKLSLSLPEIATPVEVEAEVRWTAQDLAASSPGVGIAFRNVVPQTSKWISDILAALPASTEPAPAPTQPVADKPVLRVLLRESSPTLRSLLRFWLEQLGTEKSWTVETVIAHDAAACRKAVTGRRCHLAIVDQDQAAEPVGLMLRSIRSNSRHAKMLIVLLTTQQLTLDATLSPNVMILTKPIVLRPLLATIGLVGSRLIGG